MKQFPIFILFLLFFCGPVHPVHAAIVDSQEITGSSDTPIPDTYSTTNTQSIIFTSLANKTEFCAFNDSTVGAYINVDNGSLSTAPATGVHEIYLPPKMGRCGHTRGSSHLYLRGASSITLGTIHIDVE